MEPLSGLLKEQRVSLKDAAKRESRTYRTVLTWVDVGVRGVRLESFRQGGRRFTTVQAIERFTERTTLGAFVETTSEEKQRTSRAHAAALRIKLLHTPRRLCRA
jgi:hypothetical protein